jgi:sarcosine oxidase, subunit alpha
MMYRLAPVEGEWLDRDRPLDFTFEGEALRGYDGDTLSSALAGAGIMTMARSFKYHRARGLYSAAAHDANNLFQSGATPNLRGDSLPLRAGITFEAVNTMGGLRRDRGRWIERLAAFLPVGFYYKAAIGRRLFPRFERVVRRLSGLGRVQFDDVHVATAKRYASCDVAVIGSGIAGMNAALAAAANANVTLLEETPRLGGSGLWARAAEPDRCALARELAARVLQHPRITVITSACAVGYYSDHLIAVAETQRLTKLRARAVVIATGAIEQPAIFANNDLPGVLLASAAQRLVYRHAVAPGRRVCVLAGNRDGLEAALDMQTLGIEVALIIDLRPSPADDAELCAALRRADVRLVRDCTALAAVADARGCLTAIELAQPVGRLRIACDALLLSVGWMPTLQLALQAGATTTYDLDLQQLVPLQLPAGLFIAGRANGCYATAAKALDGSQAGSAAARHALRIEPSGERLADTANRSPGARSLADPYLIDADAAAPSGKSFVDLDEDLTANDLRNAMQEGFDSVELLKRYSTVGMGPSQGKLSNMNAARLLAARRDRGLGQLGLTTARPPYQPVSLALLAGRGFTPERRSSLDTLHDDRGAVWMPAGNWRRPEYYRRAGSTRAQCIEDEVLAVRNGVGIIDVGTLGKIEVRGPDAATLLERVYTGRYADMKNGSTRYALMLDDSGTVIDDGVVARIGAAHFYFTTTTSGSATVYRELLRQVAEQRYDCVLHNLTGHLAALNVAGPRARELLQVCTAADLTAAAFPYLAARQAQVLGEDALLLRVGFVGELGYEIHLPHAPSRKLWTALLEAGASVGVRPFGVEAQRILRLEKAHLIVGQDTDGLTNPFEANAGWAVRMDKPWFTGQRSLRILQQRGPRQQLVGFELATPNPYLKECHLVIDRDAIGGRITSIARSPTLQRQVGLALVSPALATLGSTLQLRGDDRRLTPATVVATPFYDPQQLRQRMPTELSSAA